MPTFAAASSLLHRRSNVRVQKRWLGLNTNSAHPRKFFVPIQMDGNMHHYEFALADSGLAKDESITQMNVYPVFLRQPGEKSSFTLKSFGFLRDKGEDFVGKDAAVARASE